MLTCFSLLLCLIFIGPLPLRTLYLFSLWTFGPLDLWTFVRFGPLSLFPSNTYFCPMNYNRLLVTAALPYANGPVHIGHLAGCYLPADIYVRYLRAKKRDVKFICGSDEHGVPITIKARK